MLHLLALIVLAWLILSGLAELLAFLIRNAYWLIPAAVVAYVICWLCG